MFLVSITPLLRLEKWYPMLMYCKKPANQSGINIKVNWMRYKTNTMKKLKINATIWFFVMLEAEIPIALYIPANKINPKYPQKIAKIL